MIERLSVKLIRDDSELSKEAEDFLKSNNIDYSVLYSTKEDVSNLPVIFDSIARYPYEGKKGLLLFKRNYQKSA